MAAVPENRTATGRFAPGHSGNAGGRPRDTESVRSLVREHGKTIVDRLIRIALGQETRTVATLAGTAEVEPSFSEQTKAAEVLMAYWIGKPAQPVELAHAERTVSDQLEDVRKSERGSSLISLAEAIAGATAREPVS